MGQLDNKGAPETSDQVKLPVAGLPDRKHYRLRIDLISSELRSVASPYRPFIFVSHV